MKKSKFLLAIALAGLLVACGGNNGESNDVPGSTGEPSVSVKGPDSTGPESVTGNSTGSDDNKPSTSVGSDSETKPSESVGPNNSVTDPSTSVVDPTPTPDTFTFYLSPVEGISWDNYYVYTWNSETDTPKVSWPGEMMNYDSEKQYYTYEIEKGAYDKIIFNNGLNDTDPGAHQTKDLAFDYEHPVFFLTSLTGGQWGNIGDHFDPIIPDTFTFYLSPVEGISWDNYYVYTWNSETDTPKVGWPGEMMNYDSEKQYYTYEIEKDAYDKVIFSNGLDSTVEGAHQTKDLEFDYEHPVFFLTSLKAGQWGNIGDHFDPVVDPIPGGEMFKFYLSPIEGVSWDNYYVYTWNSETDTPKVGWPGEMMNYDSENDCYMYEIEKGTYNKVIFSNGLDSTVAGAHQTDDLEFDYEHPVFFLTSLKGGKWGNFGDSFDPVDPDPIPGGDVFTFYLSPIDGVSWNNYYVYTWNSDTNKPKAAWPGELMTLDSEHGCYKYEVEKDAYNKVIFSNGMNSTDAGAHQTGDLSYDYEHPVYFLTSVNGAGKWGNFGDNFEQSEVFKWFVIGEMTGWGVNDNYGMKSQGNNIFAYTGSFSAGVPFKIVSDSNNWYGGEKLDSASQTYVTIDTSDNNNMKFKNAGTYTITWNASTNTISITAAK
ncbi:MAG: starch-binding protein [Erysipelotrichales bacterium]|nr:starch-binding protein [Erysipelotrichales bacterium]